MESKNCWQRAQRRTGGQRIVLAEKRRCEVLLAVSQAPTDTGSVGGSPLGRQTGLTRLQIPQPLLDIDVHALVSAGQIARIELVQAHFFQAVGPDGVGENRKKIFDSQLRRLKPVRVV